MTVTHDDFAPDSEVCKGVSEGWPMILSNLKSVLESGKPLDFAVPLPVLTRGRKGSLWK